jgi:hypothetical protein
MTFPEQMFVRQDEAMNAEEPIRSALIEILGTGAVARDEVVDELLKRGLLQGPSDAAREVLDRAVQMDTGFSGALGDQLTYMPSVLNGTTWTTWIAAADAEHGFVRSAPDLSVMTWWLISDEVRLTGADGVDLGVLDTDGLLLDGRDTDVILGPKGWLDGLQDTWAAVTVTDGALRFTKVDAPPQPTARQIAAVSAGFAAGSRIVRSSSSVNIAPPPDPHFVTGDEVLHAALAIDREAFVESAVPPMAALLAGAGLVERSGLVAEPGFDWEALHRWQRANSFRLRYGVAEELLDDLDVAIQACTSGEPIVDAALAERCARALDDGPAAAGFWEHVGERGMMPEDIGAFAEAVDAAAPGASRYGTAWLRSRAMDAAGDAVAAADALVATAGPGCEHGPLLIDAAGFAADRGDAVSAYRLLRQAGVPDRSTDPEDDDFDPTDEAQLLMNEVRQWALNRPAPMARRNEACPCGSGRKYKACHLGRETHPLHDRSAWLYQKARRYLLGRFDDLIVDLAELAAGDDPELIDEIAELPLLHDIVLHEDGIFAMFLAARAELLPDDEALLATQWSLVDRGVYEIVRVGTRALDLRDIGRGETITVANVTPGAGLQIGGLLCGRPLPVGDTYRAMSGFLPLPLRLVGPMSDAVAAGDAEAVVDVVRAVFARPTVIGPDGEEVEWPLRADSDLGVPMDSLSQDDPEIRRLMSAHIAQYEARWLDESIPALGGRTPRDAVNDPVGREDVIRLLASLPIPRDGDVSAMDPRRLRAALGL